MTGFSLLLLFTSVFAGGVASVAGFGIGSILTPVLALQTGTKIAVAAIAIPHFIATFIRFWIMRAHVNRKVLLHFGIASAVGGLGGALLHASFQSNSLTLIFGGLLVFSGFTGMTGLAQRMRLHGIWAWLAGILSGGFGGLVGNQGGIRSAALMTFDLGKESLVATATAIAVLVDVARVPVYLASDLGSLQAVSAWIAIAAAGVVVGTILGIRFLRGISEGVFRRLLGALILALGVYMISRGLGA